METQINYFISTDLVNQIRMTKEFVAHNREKVVDLVTWEDSDLHKEYKQDRYKKWINMIVVDKISSIKFKKQLDSSKSSDHYIILDDITNLVYLKDKGVDRDRPGNRLIDFIEHINQQGPTGLLCYVNEINLYKFDPKLLYQLNYEVPENKIDLFTNSRNINITTESLDMDSYLIQNGPGVANIIKKMQMWEMRSN